MEGSEIDGGAVAKWKSDFSRTFQYYLDRSTPHTMQSFSVYGERYAITKAFVVAFLLTFFSVLDVPVFWPILLCYWIFLFFLTMKRQILHMIKYRYIPFDFGKQRYGGKKSASSSGMRSD
ncbi:Retrieval of early ER protein Rer1 [Corchorus capsularis]|uniref:Retrieval of early ER protein Rer1 n=1 Tax=Corchorus capsularis TaxID=210143 RepID=A0A1R3GFS1_COCAP|nr:Retrieval of early ER protein Rer1 [Corchorus capsularis]